jgi:hypothetical protein
MSLIGAVWDLGVKLPLQPWWRTYQDGTGRGYLFCMEALGSVQDWTRKGEEGYRTVLFDATRYT